MGPVLALLDHQLFIDGTCVHGWEREGERLEPLVISQVQRERMYSIKELCTGSWLAMMETLWQNSPARGFLHVSNVEVPIRVGLVIFFSATKNTLFFHPENYFSRSYFSWVFHSPCFFCKILTMFSKNMFQYSSDIYVTRVISNTLSGHDFLII